MGFNRLQAVHGLTGEMAHDGALFLARHARDAADARLLLEACGLLPYESVKQVKSRAERGRVTKHPLRDQ